MLEVGTIENSPGTEGGPDGSMWLLPEVVAFVRDLDAVEAGFNTCAFQRSSWFKPGKFVGRLGGLQGLSRRCTCPAGFRRQQLVGKELTEKAAEYPDELCTEYAKLMVKSWKRTLDLEWWRYQVANKRSEVSALQFKWWESKEKLQQKEQAAPRTSVKRAWAWTEAAQHKGPDNKMSRKSHRDEENDFAVGGMRNPWFAVRRLSKVAEVGWDCARLWRRFAKEFPEVLRAAKSYGGSSCRLEPDLVEAWKEELRELLHGKAEELILKEKIEFKSPLNASLWEAWQKMSADPEKHIAAWARQGAPLGMSLEIPACGVFPKAMDSSQAPAVEEAPALGWRSAFKNYSSVEADPEGASLELGRYVDKGFAKRMAKTEAQHRFGTGTVSKLALIVKEKGDGAIKRRIIIDLLRSGGNERARVPERIVLPRCTDFTKSVRRLWKLKEVRLHEKDALDDLSAESEDDDEGIEMIGADLSDACCHFGVAAEELKNCLAPAVEEDEILVFCAMLFGFKGAPLVMGRLSAALARLWQSMIMRDGELQLYMDDPLFAIIGPKGRRRGAQLAFHKGERGLRICWIGVQLEIVTSRALLLLTVPEKVVNELLAKMKEWKGRGMIAFRDLRATTGKLSWIAGIVPRIRWTVSILYAVVALVEADNKSGAELAQLRERTQDRSWGSCPRKESSCPGPGCSTSLSNRSCGWSTGSRWSKPQPEFLVADASPQGVGAILAAADAAQTKFEPLAALKAEVTKEVAEFLGLPFGESGSQGPLEALALVLAIQQWRYKLRNTVVLIRSDSVVALAMVKKLAASSPALNYLGACLAWNLEVGGIFGLVGHHLAGALNDEADWLSRPEKPSTTAAPAALANLKVKDLAIDLAKWYPFAAPSGDTAWGTSSEKLHSLFESL